MVTTWRDHCAIPVRHSSKVLFVTLVFLAFCFLFLWSWSVLLCTSAVYSPAFSFP